MEKIFILGSLVIAILVFTEASMLSKNDGKMPQNNLFALIGLVTALWSVVSCAAWYFLDFGKIGSAVPVVYPLYALMGLIYSGHLLKHTDLPDNPADLVLPEKYLNFSRSFALVYALLCLLALLEILGLLPI